MEKLVHRKNNNLCKFILIDCNRYILDCDDVTFKVCSPLASSAPTQYGMVTRRRYKIVLIMATMLVGTLTAIIVALIVLMQLREREYQQTNGTISSNQCE